MIQPKLRFKADDGSAFSDWEKEKFGNFITTHSEKTSDKEKYPLYSLTIESGVQPKTERYEREFLVKKEGDNYKIVPPNGFVYNPMNLRFGALKVNHEKFAVSVSGYYDVFSLKNESTLAFWENYLITPKMLQYYYSIATGSLIEKLRVHYSQFTEITKKIPSLPEQQKIADFLSAIDTIIEKQQATVKAWEQRKKGVMQKLFNQEVRFKADDGSDFPDWEEKRFGDIVKEFKEKTTIENEDTLLSCAIDGIYLNSELFGHQRGQSNIGYLKIKQGTLILSAQNLHLGNVNVNMRFKHGIISPAYKTYEIVGCNVKYMNQWVKWDKTKQFFYNATTVGASGCRRNVDWMLLYQQVLKLPSPLEQQKIADCLSALDDVIKKQKETLEKWKELKKGLLQQMFV